MPVALSWVRTWVQWSRRLWISTASPFSYQTIRWFVSTLREVVDADGPSRARGVECRGAVGPC